VSASEWLTGRSLRMAPRPPPFRRRHSSPSSSGPGTAVVRLCAWCGGIRRARSSPSGLAGGGWCGRVGARQRWRVECGAIAPCRRQRRGTPGSPGGVLSVCCVRSGVHRGRCIAVYSRAPQVTAGVYLRVLCGHGNESPRVTAVATRGRVHLEHIKSPGG
jgi:hypothetical protein